MSVPIHVYANGEHPSTFMFEGERYEITEVLKRWHERSYDCFKVVTTDGGLFVLRYETSSDQWTMGTEFCGAELLRKPEIQMVLVGVDEVRTAQRLIASCEHCYPDAALVPFGWLIARVTGKHGVFDFLMAEIPRCPLCDWPITEGTLVETKDKHGLSSYSG